MVVQWLRLHAANTGAQDWSLVGKLGSHMPCGMAKKIKKKKKEIRKTEDTNDLILYFYFSLNNNRATSPSE